MLKEQEMFLNFMLEKVAPENTEATKGILVDAFAKLATDEFDIKEFEKVATKLEPLVKPEYKEDVDKAMASFAESLK